MPDVTGQSERRRDGGARRVSRTSSTSPSPRSRTPRCRRTRCCAPIPPSTRRSPIGSKISLIVSAGPAKVKVPPVEGLTEAAARNQLALQGLGRQRSFLFRSRPVRTEDGIVISQSIPGGESVDPGTTIRLQVGKAAPAPTTTLAPTTTTIPPTTTTPPTADLGVTITDGANSKPSGSSVTYTIVASNSGPVGSDRRIRFRHHAERSQWRDVDMRGGWQCQLPSQWQRQHQHAGRHPGRWIGDVHGQRDGLASVGHPQQHGDDHDAKWCQ